MNKFESGISTFIIIFIIVLAGVLAGGVAYYFGSQKYMPVSYKTEEDASQKAPNASTKPTTGISDKTDNQTIGGEIDNTSIDTINSDFAEIEADLETLQ